MADTAATQSSGSSSGLIVGGLGGDGDQLLEDGQEEVFSRAEVESGAIEHAVEAGGDEARLDDRLRSGSEARPSGADESDDH